MGIRSDGEHNCRPEEIVFDGVYGLFEDQPNAYGGDAPEGYGVDAEGEPSPMVQQRRVDEHEQLGRNDPCWCGSGKKYKKCHGA